MPYGVCRDTCDAAVLRSALIPALSRQPHRVRRDGVDQIGLPGAVELVEQRAQMGSMR